MKTAIAKIRSDYHRYTGHGDRPFIRIIAYLLFGRNHCFNYSFWLRLAHEKSWIWPLAMLMHKRLSVKYSMQIPRICKIGYGLYLGHGIQVPALYGKRGLCWQGKSSGAPESQNYSGHHSGQSMGLPVFAVCILQ